MRKVKQIDTLLIAPGVIQYTAVCADGTVWCRRNGGEWSQMPDIQSPQKAHRSPQTKAERFTPPTIKEVQNYCSERSNGVNAKAFVDHYAMKGWKVGKDTMKDWKAAVRTWENRQEEQRVVEKQAAKPQYSIFTGTCPCGKVISEKRPKGGNLQTIPALCPDCGERGVKLQKIT